MFFKDLDYKSMVEAEKPKRSYRKGDIIKRNIVEVVTNNPTITNKDLALKVNKSLAHVKRYLRVLVESGILTSELTYCSFPVNGTLKILTTRKLTCNIKKPNQ